MQLTQWREQAGTGDALDTQRSISTLEQAREHVVMQTPYLILSKPAQARSSA